MTKIFSPNNVDVLLHYYTSPNPHPRLEAEAVLEVIEMFVDLGCLAINGEDFDTLRITPKGKAWVRALCDVECPRVAFVDNNGNVLGYEEEEKI